MEWAKKGVKLIINSSAPRPQRDSPSSLPRAKWNNSAAVPSDWLSWHMYSQQTESVFAPAPPRHKAHCSTINVCARDECGEQTDKQAGFREDARVCCVNAPLPNVGPQRSQREPDHVGKWAKPGSEGLGGLALRPIQTFPSDTEPGAAGDDVRKTETHSRQSLLRKNRFFLWV